jgi:peptidoglycan L-alanyl-D-glutamate endopeptidase CwlK
MPLNSASEKKLERVKPDLVDVVRRASEISPTPFQIVQGNRTQAEQDALYAQGRTKRGNIVTWTRNSKHIGGNAVDFAALVNGKVSWNDKLYPSIANAFKEAAQQLKTGIEWGGDWKTKDWGHIQLTQKNPTPRAPTAGKGWTISDVQNALVKHGVDPGPVDGILGRKTRAALAAFQKRNGLPETGAPDKATTDALARPVGKPVTLLDEAQLVQPDTEVGSPRWAVSYLEGLGWSHIASVALVANLMWESGGRNGTIDWSAHGDKGRDGKFHSHGAGQWNDRHGRYQNLLQYAEENGTAWDAPQTQLGFMDHELRSTEARTAKELQTETTIEGAMPTALSYWRPSIPHTDKRIAIANALEAQTKETSDA